MGTVTALEEFDAAVEAVSDRLRALPESVLRRGAAARGLRLARELARRAWELEGHGDAAPPEVPDLGIFVVADQVAVTGHDLSEALRRAVTPPSGGPAAEAAALLRGWRP